MNQAAATLPDVVTPPFPGMVDHAGALAPASLTRRGNGRAGQRTNPCLRVYGTGPAEVICKTCARFHSPEYHGKRYHKCELRGFTHGPCTDHRVGWPACSRYEERGVA